MSGCHHAVTSSIILKNKKQKNCQPQLTSGEQRLDQLQIPVHTSQSAATTPSPPLPSHQYLLPALGMCVRMVYTLKTNRHPIATEREMDVGLEKVGDRGRRDGIERKRQEQGPYEREKKRSREGGGHCRARE